MALIIRAGTSQSDTTVTKADEQGLLDPVFVQSVLKGYPEFSQLSQGITLNGVVYDRVLMNEDAKHSELGLNQRATTLLEEHVCLEGPIVGDVLLLTSGEHY
ncbi:hypothetical protein J9231_00440 [Providencia rettgeri]|uniref:hypothetical protein n=1 Tax=Providencia rettgeri TaxID=587 RepID=UPI001B397A67|nr:hypothetical protein [Providencia rettgeri]MBQ0326315.1 hypothetical protein [Providencia rettgeri]